MRARRHLAVDEPFFKALAFWLVGLESGNNTSKMSGLERPIDGFQYLTGLKRELSVQYILDAWMKPKTERRFESHAASLLSSSWPRENRFKQVLWRLLRLAHQYDNDSLRRSTFFQHFICRSDRLLPRDLRSITSEVCEVNTSLSDSKQGSHRYKAGSLLFKDERVVPSGISLQAQAS